MHTWYAFRWKSNRSEFSRKISAPLPTLQITFKHHPERIFWTVWHGFPQVQHLYRHDAGLGLRRELLLEFARLADHERLQLVVLLPRQAGNFFEDFLRCLHLTEGALAHWGINEQSTGDVRYNIWPNFTWESSHPILPYFGKRKQVTKVKFLVKEKNVPVISTDINGISSCLT